MGISIMNFQVGDVVGICPNCHNPLVVKTGRYGKFIGCSNFPKCRKTYDYENFRIREEAIEYRELENASLFDEIKRILIKTKDNTIKRLAKQKLIKEGYCSECGSKVKTGRVYRTTPDYPHYLKEHHCPNCGTYITTETPSFASFTRMGTIDENGDDSHITGGYWL